MFVYLFICIILLSFCFACKETVDNAEAFPEVLDKFHQWLEDNKLGSEYKFGVVTDG